MSLLKEDYKEPEFRGEKEYTMDDNGDGTVSFNDVTEYRIPGDYIRSADINATNTQINSLMTTYSRWISAHSALKTNFQDAQFSGKKIFRMVDNGDGTVSLTDETTYTTSGSQFNATHINNANSAVNDLKDGYNTGIARIKNALLRNGAKSTNDILAAIDAVVTRQNELGYEKGIADVKTNPSGYHLVDDSTYQTQVSANNDLKNRMAFERNKIYTYRGLFTDQKVEMDSLTDTLIQDANTTIFVGQSADDALHNYDLIGNHANSVMAPLQSSYATGYNTQVATFVSELRGLL